MEYFLFQHIFHSERIQDNVVVDSDHLQWVIIANRTKKI